jgi:putative hydrolase of the HAD superfamily
LKVVWDFGAVLFRWRPAALLQRVLPQHAFDEASAAHWREAIFGAFDGAWSDFDRGVLTVDQVVQSLALRTGFAVEEIRALIDAVPGELDPIDETWALHRALQARGLPQYYLSNMPATYAAFIDDVHAQRLGGFDDGIYSSHVKLIKPEAALYALAESRFGLDPANTLFFDDHAANVEAACSRGWHAVQVTGPAAVADGLRRFGLA